jgi:hypothetical protein
MSKLHISQIKLEDNGDEQMLSAMLTTSQGPRQVWFRVGPGPVNATAEPFLPVALIPAMRRNWDLKIEGPVARALVDGAGHIQRIMRAWYPKFRQIRIHAEMSEPVSRTATGCVAAFFSGGVDSFFTLSQHKDEITHLVFVHGFDLMLDDVDRRHEMALNGRNVAKSLDLEFIEVETNLRDFGNPHVGWPEAYFGAGLGSVALLLAPRFDRIYIPASISRDHLIPVGSHPELDHHWSNGQIEIVHDGVEFDRFEKIEAIAGWSLVTEHLRICWQREHAGLNCGRCRKCLWTMMVLEAIGRLESMRTLPPQIDLDAIAQFTPHEAHERLRFVKAIDRLAERGVKPELQAALAALVARGDRESAEAKSRSPWQRVTRKLQRLMRKR